MRFHCWFTRLLLAVSIMGVVSLMVPCGARTAGAKDSPGSPGAPGPLASLERLQPGRTMCSSSSDIWNWKDGNSDARPIKPGETLVIADLEGPGRIQHIWNTIATQEQGASRLVVVRMFWDGETEPSVEVLAGRFLCHRSRNRQANAVLAGDGQFRRQGQELLLAHAFPQVGQDHGHQ